MDFYGVKDSWRCFFAASCYEHLETPALFHEYLYDSANLGYDSAAWSQYEDFRRKLTGSIKGDPAYVWNVTDGNCTAADAACAGAPATAAANLLAAVEDLESQSAVSQPSAGSGALADEGSASTLDSWLWDAQSSNVSDSSQASGRRPNVFGPACHLHEMIDGVLFTKSAINGTWLVDVLADWYAGRTQDVFILDQYDGLQSDALCGTDPKATVLLAAAMARYLVLEAGHSP